MADDSDDAPETCAECGADLVHQLGGVLPCPSCGWEGDA